MTVVDRPRTLLGNARRWILLACVFGHLSALAREPDKFDVTPWRSDLENLESALELRYPNLGWYASGEERDVDLVKSHQVALGALDAARDEREAKRALVRFVQSFHDSHFQWVPSTNERAASAAQAASDVSTESPAPASVLPPVCEDLGVEAPDRSAPSFPYASLPNLLRSASEADVFPSAVVRIPGEGKAGLIRISSFTHLQYPALCERAVADLTAQGASLSAKGVRDLMKDRWLSELASTLARLKQEKADVLIVDITHNFGGNDFGDWVVRMFTAAPVRSARLLLARGPGAAAYVDDQLRGLRRGLSLLPEGHAGLPAEFRESIGAFELRRSRLANQRACGSMSWVWREHRRWTPGLCDGLVDMGYASGNFDYLPPVVPGLADIASYVYWPAVVDRYRGSWAGKVYLLTDAEVYSSAEMFAASMRDNGVARIIGQRTGRAGCGNMSASSPIELPYSRLRFHIPDCVRLRADGSNEIAGVAPDIEFAVLPNERGSANAQRLLEVVRLDLQAAPLAKSVRAWRDGR